MYLRRCATQGCPGTLPVGTGTHCPRCGGTAFIRPRRGGRRALTIVALAGMAVILATLLAAMRTARTAPTSSGDRRALVESRDVAARMNSTSTRDEAYAEILHRALAQHDFEYACQLGSEMTGPSAKDKCLLETVEEALKANQRAWATRAAGEIVSPSTRDDAYRQIMDATSPE